jgi:hypothetical protein
MSFGLRSVEGAKDDTIKLLRILQYKKRIVNKHVWTYQHLTSCCGTPVMLGCLSSGSPCLPPQACDKYISVTDMKSILVQSTQCLNAFLRSLVLILFIMHRKPLLALLISDITVYRKGGQLVIK